MNLIDKSFKHGKNFKIGSFNIIQEGCECGDDVTIENYVLLKKNTKIGNNVFIDSYVRSSGNNRIGDNVVIRYGTTLAREVIVESGTPENPTFISPNVMTIYISHKLEKKMGIVIGGGAFIGTNAVIGTEVKIGPKVVIGAMAYVNKDCLEPGVYVGIPVRKIK